MAWIDTTYVGYLIGSTQLTALTGGDATLFAQFEASSRATVNSVLMEAGYPQQGSTVNTATDAGAFLAKLCAAVFVRDLYGNRKGIVLPPAVQDGLTLLDAVYAKKLPVPGLDRNTSNGVGGGQFPVSSQTSTSDAARPQRFDRASLRGF